MSATSSPTETIRLIDKRIDGIRLELFRRNGRFNTFNCHDWQLAWDRNPDLRMRQEMLFGRRDLAVMERDALIERVYRRDQRRQRNALRKAA